jgi:hypothetical protein
MPSTSFTKGLGLLNNVRWVGFSIFNVEDDFPFLQVEIKNIVLVFGVFGIKTLRATGRTFHMVHDRSPFY